MQIIDFERFFNRIWYHDIDFYHLLPFRFLNTTLAAFQRCSFLFFIIEEYFFKSFVIPHTLEVENARRGCFVERNDNNNNNNNNNNNTAVVVVVAAAATSSFSFWRARRGEERAVVSNTSSNEIIINFCGTRTAREEAL